ncbi:MAG: AIM24 family protein [Planctomycetota bacterium]
MKFELEGNPDYGDLVVELDAGEEILSESGAMSRMSGDLDLKSRMMGGFGKALIRKLVGGESLFCAFACFKYSIRLDASCCPTFRSSKTDFALSSASSVARSVHQTDSLCMSNK